MICCFTVNSFLFMSLPTAGMVIGWVSTVINLFQSGMLFKSNDIIEFIRTRSDSIPTNIFDGASVALSILTALSLLDLITSVMLIIGVNKRNHLFLLPWLINNGFFLVIKHIFGIGMILMILNQNVHNSPGPVLIVLIILILAFLCMVWNAIYSLFQSIRKTNEQEILDTSRLVGNPGTSVYELLRNPA